MFFDVLGFEPMNGNPKEILLHADQVMLAESFSRTIFGRKDPVGQLVLLNGTDSLTVMGLSATRIPTSTSAVSICSVRSKL